MDFPPVLPRQQGYMTAPESPAPGNVDVPDVTPAAMGDHAVHDTVKRRQTRTVTMGGVKIGSGHPVQVQSMTKTKTADWKATVEQILRYSTPDWLASMKGLQKAYSKSMTRTACGFRPWLQCQRSPS